MVSAQCQLRNPKRRINPQYLQMTNFNTFAMTKQNGQGCSARCSFSYLSYLLRQGPGKKITVNYKYQLNCEMKLYKAELSRVDYMDPNFEQGSQPLSPTTALNLAGYGLLFPYFPRVKQVAEYSAVAAPMLKPPTPSFTVKITQLSKS